MNLDNVFRNLDNFYFDGCKIIFRWIQIILDGILDNV